MNRQILTKFQHLKQAEYAYLRDLSELDFVDIFRIEEVVHEITVDRVHFARSLFERAKVEKNTEDVSLRKRISMCYYSQYHCARAVVFHTHRYDTDSHKHLPIEIEGILGQEFKDMLKDWREKRNKVDYELYLDFDLHIAAGEALRATEIFLERATDYLRKRRVDL